MVFSSVDHMRLLDRVACGAWALFPWATLHTCHLIRMPTSIMTFMFQEFFTVFDSSSTPVSLTPCIYSPVLLRIC